MPRFTHRFFVLLGVVLSLLISAASPTLALAQGPQTPENPTTCEFQPIAADRRPTVDVIRPIDRTSGTISWDLSLLGLHRWNLEEIPAVDILVDNTVPFKNGGIIARAYYHMESSGLGGGYSLEINGKEECRGWRVYIGHLAYDPRDVYSIGQEIGPDEIIGKPGCSGFERYCTDNGGKIAPHNHYGIGYDSNVFDFKDGTVPDYFGGYWWVHPGKLEGASVQTVSLPVSTESQESLSFPIDEYVSGELAEVTQPPQPVVDLSNLMYRFRTVMIVMLGLLSIVFLYGLFFSGEFRRTTAPVGFVFLLGLVFFIRLNQAHASQAVQSIPQAEEADVYVTSGYMEDSYTTLGQERSEEDNNIVVSEDGKPSKNPADYPLNASTPCEVSSKFSQRVLQWCGLITYYSDLRGIDPNFVAAVMTQESGGNPEACNERGRQVINGIAICGSSSGAIGLMQVMASDGISGERYTVFKNRPTALELLNPELNIAKGTEILRDAGATTDFRTALIRYYGADKDGYVNTVMSIYNNNR